MTSRTLLPLAIALLVAWPGHAEAGNTLDGKALQSYINSVMEAYGGAKAVTKQKTHRIEGVVEAHIRGDKGEFRRDSSAPDSMRVVLTYPTRSEVRILAGTKGWRGDATTQKPALGMPHTAMMYQMIRSSAPWFMRDCRKRLKHGATIVDKGKTYLAMRLKWSESLIIDFWIEDQSRRLVKVQGILIAHGAKMVFETQYSDFRKVDGVLVPHTEKSIVRDKHTGTTRVTSVDFAPKDLGPFEPKTLSPEPLSK